jgi:hypothetical protein
METFASNENKNILYYDYPFYKKTDKFGGMIDLENSDALAQAVKIWLVCKPNEKIRTLGGGILSKYIGKMMDDEQASRLRNDIIQGLQYEFVPKLTPILVEVNPNYEKERWEVNLVAVSEKLGVGINTNLVVSNR